ncbi:erythromycin esterase family protein [Deinococcus pimensis]|uniref:erythromycin esterase family protein n=1 Tax=Deinococcus pimensis TaxID=309888 RepID=UPI000486B6CC|nr:erythromycin esterase family protein [Deinococcus pimensis]
MTTSNEGADAVRRAARPLAGGSDDYDGLLDAIGDARLVLIGEASHGTREFYRERARITRRLIEERGFRAVAVEADWPDALRVHRYVRGASGDASALEALGDFERFPRWMWRNEDVQHFVEWLREHNERHPEAGAGFYGIDLYSLHRSMDAVVEYLRRTDPEAAERARARYACFEHFGEDPQAYGYAAGRGVGELCEDAVVEQLVELRRREDELLRAGGSPEEHFHAEQNARLALNAERYYRAMFRGREDTWNLRDTHMMDTLDALREHLGPDGRGPARVVVWAHNSHLGDARATDMGERRGELNVGQLARERHPDETFLIGQLTHHGEVTAADDWGDPARRRRVRPGLRGSHEELLHGVGLPAFWLDLRHEDTPEVLREERLQRFIGVIYAPRTERWSHYSHARLTEQYDAVLYFDGTNAVVPLDPTSGWTEGEPLDTSPSGL